MEAESDVENESFTRRKASKLMDQERLQRIRNPQNRRISVVLPNVIPWEHGSNKYACQKGMGGFGTFRREIPKIHTSKQLSESNDGVVPWHACPSLKSKIATQSGTVPFGSHRTNVTHVKEHENEKMKRIHDIIVDPGVSDSILKIWAKPNKEAGKSPSLYGQRRQTMVESTGGRRFTPEEIQKSRASVPRFQCFQESNTAREAKTCENGRRQVITPVKGLDLSEQHKLDSNRYMAWLGGQVTLQSQSRTGGFNKTRDVVSPSYYAKLMNERETRPVPRRHESESSTLEEKEIL
ncbi:CaLponIn-liKe protein [Ditylenchus destructor]|uniref:CaLponIn-liKe protein n=1 Tax=Ditylenchus destructor TaxID=166010 RepID=A0AAD4MY43_9BILA|nr:CaLponIn-liKe protein [Ditylenchus destructor]